MTKSSFQVERLEFVEEAHAKGVWAVAPLPEVSDGKEEHFITGGCDGALRTWSFASSQKTEDLEDKSKASITANRSSINGPVRVFERHNLPVVDVAVSRERGVAVSTSLDGVVKVWSLDTLVSESKSISQPNVGDTWGIDVSRDGERAVTGGAGGNVQIIDLQLCMVEQTYSATGGHNSGKSGGTRNAPARMDGPMVMAVALRDDDTHVVLGASDGSIVEMNVETGAIVANIKGVTHGGPVRSVAYIPGERGAVVSASDDGLVCVHHMNAENTSATLRGHTGMVLTTRPSADGRCIASGGSDAVVKIWDRGERRSIFDSTVHSEPVWGVAWTRGGTHVVSVADDSRIGALYCRTDQP